MTFRSYLELLCKRFFTYLSKYIKFRQHNSVLQPLQTETTKFSGDSDTKLRNFSKEQSLLSLSLVQVAVVVG